MKYRSALIVGAGSGLSAALARRFAEGGLNVALAARRTDKLAALCAETGARAHACDAASPESVAALFAALEAAPDVVVFNASARVRGAVAELDPAEVRRALDITAFGGFLVAREALRRMLPRGEGALLLTGATAGVEGLRQLGRLRDGQVRAARPGPGAGARGIARRHPRRPFRDRRRYRECRAFSAGGSAGQPAGPGRDRRDLLARDAPAPQRLELGGRIAAVGGAVLTRQARQIHKET
jgi:NAD(P)-dependent dehydrogenase (short-subunit alcohol dehydrogenase family)